MRWRRLIVFRIAGNVGEIGLVRRLGSMIAFSNGGSFVLPFSCPRPYRNKIDIVIPVIVNENISVECSVASRLVAFLLFA